MKDSGDTYYVTVIEDLNKRLVVATGTLIIEQKFIHECATVSISLLFLLLMSSAISMF